jgi:hypothetical protein
MVSWVLALLCGVMPADSRFVGNELLGRPTDTSVTIQMFPAVDVSVYVTYGPAGGALDSVTTALEGRAWEPMEIVLDGLSPDTAYEYVVWRRAWNESEYVAGRRGHFQTQRSPAATFLFTVTSDSHLQNKLLPEPDETKLAMLRQVFENVGAAGADFHIMLGDDVGIENCEAGCATGFGDALERYLDQRPYLDIFEGSLPLFVVLGNHEGEQGWRLDGTCANLAQWGFRARTSSIPNPLPDGFYSGNEDVDPCNGLRGDYYAWEWGDALLVALDPFWYTTVKPHSLGRDGVGSEDSWDWTLGEAQYRWLERTLSGSRRRWKFVLLHHLTGGVNTYGRGGVEAVRHALGGQGSYEWGGENADGTWGFSERRPGWDQPIHQVLVENGVTMVLHGHDHFYAKQVLDGVYYQECPVPGSVKYSFGFMNQGLYERGVLLPNTGHLEVQVSPIAVRVDYIRGYLPGKGVNGELAHRYVISVVDADRDGDVDLSDYGVLLGCWNGPNVPWLGDERCAAFDTNRDGDVDLSDFGVFVSCYNGPGRLPSCE